MPESCRLEGTYMADSSDATAGGWDSGGYFAELLAIMRDRWPVAADDYQQQWLDRVIEEADLRVPQSGNRSGQEILERLNCVMLAEGAADAAWFGPSGCAPVAGAIAERPGDGPALALAVAAGHVAQSKQVVSLPAPDAGDLAARTFRGIVEQVAAGDSQSAARAVDSIRTVSAGNAEATGRLTRLLAAGMMQIARVTMPGASVIAGGDMNRSAVAADGEVEHRLPGPAGMSFPGLNQPPSARKPEGRATRHRQRFRQPRQGPGPSL